MKKANKADCIRRAINISSQKDFFKFDKKSYDANKIKKYIQITSPKLFELIKTIIFRMKTYKRVPKKKQMQIKTVVMM